MKLQFIAVFVSLFLFTGAVLGGNLIADPAYNRTELIIDRSDQNAIEMEFKFSGVDFLKVTHGVGQYDLLSIEREGFSGVIGAPEVPLITRLFAIPDRAKVRIASVEPQYETYQNVHPYPHQEYEYGHPDNSPDVVAGDEYYRSGKLFPETWLSVGEPAILRDYRIVPVTVSPIRVNAATGEAMVLTSLRVKLEFDDGGAVNVKTHHFNKSVSSFSKMYRGVISNYDWVNKNNVELKGSIIVIYPNVTGVASALAPYIEWKTRMGYNVIVQQVSNGANTATIFNHISNAYQNADPPLESAVLIGDANGTIALSCYFVSSSGSSDHPYTTLEGIDFLADITIGRITVDNTTQLQTAINKILYYEKQPDLIHTEWYKKGAVVAGSSSSGLSTIQVNQNIRTWWLQDGFTQVDSLWYNMGGSVPSFITAKCNSGISALNYRGWLGVNGFTYSGVMDLDNAFKLPYSVVITCGSGDFGSSSTDDVCEGWIRAGSPAQPKGGIGGIGTATSSTHTRYNNAVCGGLWFGVHYEGLTTLGEALFRGKIELYNAYINDIGQAENFTEWNNLMGDPTTDLWNDIPQVLDVTHPAEVAVGASSFTVIVEDQAGNPMEDRYVCLWKGTEVFIAGRTDENGVYTAPISVQSAGTLKLTITYHNDYPFVADIPVVSEDVYPSFYHLTIDDDNLGSSQGNNDGNANPSEILELGVELKNFGTSITATNISATLSTDDPNVAITQAEATYPNLSPGSTSSGNSSFVVEMDSEFPQGYMVQFALNIETDQGDFESAFYFNVNSGELIPVNIQITGGGLNPGNTDDIIVTFKNVGLFDLTNVAVTISLDDEQATVEDSIGTFGNIPSGMQAVNSSDPFVISVESYATSGRVLDIDVHIASENGFEQNMSVAIAIGGVTNMDPFGPDDYGYYCIDNMDGEYIGHPTYQWIEIDPNQGGLPGTMLNLPDYSEEGDVSVAFPIPFTFTYYGQDFDFITVCSNGWIGTGNLAYYDDFRNYPLPSAFGPVGGMIAPYWDDIIMGSGHVYAYSDEANHRIIIEWSRVDLLQTGTQTHTFEVILYDPAYYPTPTGDGEILFQYHTVSPTSGPYWDNPYFTTGIQNIDHNDGLQYAYWNVYNPAAPTLQSGRAIKFTTEEPYKLPNIPSIELTMEPANPPIVIPPSGGSFQYNANAENTGEFLNVFDYWVIVTLPDSSILGPVILREGLQLQPGNSINRDLTQNVPANAPAGNYVYSGYVGIYHCNDVWDWDEFTFSKSGVTDGGIDNWNVTGWDLIPEPGVAIDTPTEFALYPAAPNPFNPSTEIRYALPQAGKVKIAVYNTLGREVAVLQDGWMNAGWHNVTFNAHNLSSGLYFYTIQTEGFAKTQKMLLIK